MNWKLVSAFATGAVLASGIVYFAVRPVEVGSVEPPPPKPVVAAAVKTPAPVAPPPPAPVPTVAAAPVQVPVREKPSPMPPPVRRPKEVATAKYVPPPVPPPVPPMTPAPPTVEVTPPPPPPAAPPPAPVAPPIPVENVSLPAPSADARVPHTVTLAAGTLLPVRIGETLSSARNQAGDKFLATLIQPLVIDGFIIADRGARVEGRVIEASQAGKVKGASHLEISIVRLATDDGQNIRIRTEPYVKDGSSSSGTDAAKIGGGAAIGAIIGAIAGGGKGAAIGAGAGGAIGAGDVLLTRGQTAEIKVEARISFKVQDSVTITERLD